MLHGNSTVSEEGTSRAATTRKRAARKSCRNGRPAPLNAEQTPVGVQTLVSGVAPITPAQRLAHRANAPLEPKKAQRPADQGLFDTNSRNQIEMF